jgi:hypothetical protein
MSGRNDPCPCGSGRKFKQCHGRLGQAEAPSPDVAWQRLRAALDGFPTTMYRFIREVYGPEAIEEAWEEFTLFDDEEPPFDPDTPYIEVFMAWFYHHWEPDPDDTTIEDARLHGRSPTSVLLATRGGRLDPVLRRYLEACGETEFSFHEVLGTEPGRGLRTRDVLTGTEREVLERSASRTLRPGDIFFGQLVTSDGVTLIEASGRHAIPPGDKLAIVDFRESISGGEPLTEGDLLEWDFDIRGLYLDLTERMLHPRPPRLQNTDGEELVFHRLIFEIDSPRAAFDALKHLAFDESEEELLEGVDLDRAGESPRVDFAWKVAGNRKHKSWDNTVHGHISIEGRELRAEVNSAGRAERLQAIVEERLGDAARLVRTETQDAAEMMAAARELPPDDGSGGALPLDDPQVRAAIRDVMAKHYESWVSEEIPALGGLTPLEAVKDRVGREKVEALIVNMERQAADPDAPVDAAVFARVRERLGLGAR